jgi:tetratricopeptide (TPR) repeat protein
MEHSPEKRVNALARVLARALNAEKERIEGEEPRDEGGSIFEDAHSLDNVLKDVLRRTSRVAEERAAAPAQLAELLAMPSHERESAVTTQPRLQTYSLASYTLERCEKVVSHDPMMAGELARLARTIAEHADPRACGGTAALADLESYATAMEGNAQRVAGDLRESLRTFMRARRAQDRGGADPDLSARIDMLESSLRRDLRQFPMALDLLDQAERVFVSLKDRNLQARTIINRANVFLAMRDLERVLENLRQALPVAQDPWLALVVRHNLIFALAECGHAREAADLYEASKDLYLQYNDPLTTSRRIWAEGLIARELEEDLAKAEQLLTQATERLAEHGYAFDAALAGLDLVTVYARRGHSDEVLRVASNLVHLFQVRDVHPEALAALKMVHEAAERQAVSLSLLAQATDKVRANQMRGNAAN